MIIWVDALHDMQTILNAVKSDIPSPIFREDFFLQCITQDFLAAVVSAAVNCFGFASPPLSVFLKIVLQLMKTNNKHLQSVVSCTNAILLITRQ